MGHAVRCCEMQVPMAASLSERWMRRVVGRLCEATSLQRGGAVVRYLVGPARITIRRQQTRGDLERFTKIRRSRNCLSTKDLRIVACQKSWELPLTGDCSVIFLLYTSR